jgi:hypothetical protein
VNTHDHDHAVSLAEVALGGQVESGRTYSIPEMETFTRTAFRYMRNGEWYGREYLREMMRMNKLPVDGFDVWLADASDRGDIERQVVRGGSLYRWNFQDGAA